LFSKVRELSKNITVYGLGDVAVSIVNFFLLGVYVTYFSAADYGVISVLGGLEVLAKIVFRFGLDGSFMRFFYDSDRPEDRRRLASTIFFFLLAVNGTVLAVLLIAAPAMAAALLGSRTHTTALRFMLVNTFAIGFTFIPFHVLRIERRTVTFSVMTLIGVLLFVDGGVNAVSTEPSALSRPIWLLVRPPSSVNEPPTSIFPLLRTMML